MRTRFTTFIYFFFYLLSTGFAQELCNYNFETEEATPYFFRYGNKGALGEITYKPRWCYSHNLIENPAVVSENESATVLEYTSQEARNYGLKIRFINPIDLDKLKKLQFKIYQPNNVLGKPVHSSYSTSAATQQNMCVKLLSVYNPVNDFRQEDGILLYMSKTSFTEEGVWRTFTFDFNPSDYSSQLSKFTNGVIGFSILPTYDSGVTLADETGYVCYIDDIVVNPSPSSIQTQSKDSFNINYNNGVLNITSEFNGDFVVDVCDMQGRILSSSKIIIDNSAATLSVPLLKGGYIVSLRNGQTSNSKSIFIQ